MNWYYALHGTQLGPASDEQLAQLVAEGTITASTLVWKDGMGDWQSLSVVRPDLLATVAAPQVAGMPVLPAQKDVMVQQMREGVLSTGPGELNYAGFWIRVVAKLIDFLVLGVIFMAITLLFFADELAKLMEFSAKAGAGGEQSPEDMGALVAFQIGSMFFNYTITSIYNGVMVSKWGATLGKMALGLKVTDAAGNPPSKGKCWGRAFADLINYMICYIGYIIAAFDEQKRALHDHICNTRVIKTR
jgi:uncharacterized RDD family membrane protein YckC